MCPSESTKLFVLTSVPVIDTGYPLPALPSTSYVHQFAILSGESLSLLAKANTTRSEERRVGKEC